MLKPRSVASSSPPQAPELRRGRVACPAVVWSIALAGSIGLCGFGGCTASPKIDATEVRQRAAMRYPEEAEAGEPLDIVAVRDGDRLRLINRTPRTYGAVELWLNHEYVGIVDHIRIGTDNTAHLPDFINRHGESFPTGSFLRPERSRPLVTAEIYDPTTDTRRALIVQPER